MAGDKWRGSEGIDSPSDLLFAITPDDDNDLTDTPKGITCTTAGVITLLGNSNEDDDDPVAVYCGQGQILPVRPKRVFETGTTADGIVGLY